MITANIEERDESVTDALYLLFIFSISVFQMLERSCGIHIVTRVDAYLFHILCGHIGNCGIEVDISHKRGVVTSGCEPFPD